MQAIMARSLMGAVGVHARRIARTSRALVPGAGCSPVSGVLVQVSPNIDSQYVGKMQAVAVKMRLANRHSAGTDEPRHGQRARPSHSTAGRSRRR